MTTTISTLHEEFRTAIREGDERLRERIDQQIDFVKEALAAQAALSEARFAAAEELELSRMDHSMAALEALREALSERSDTGDERLREHIDAQYGQIAAALEAARRETKFAAEASDKAISKAEAANEKRFEAANEWRQQSADRERSQESQMRELSSTFLPREVAESQFDRAHSEHDSVVQRVAALEQALAVKAGKESVVERREDRMQPWMLWAAGGILSVFIALMIFAANFLSAT